MRRLPRCSLRIDMHRFSNAGCLQMTAELKSSLVTALQSAASQAGLILVTATEGSDFHGQPTAVFELGLPDASPRPLRLELTEGFQFDRPDLLPAMTAHLAGEANRLRNPRPECYITLGE